MKNKFLFIIYPANDIFVILDQKGWDRIIFTIFKDEKKKIPKNNMRWNGICMKQKFPTNVKKEGKTENRSVQLTPREGMSLEKGM